MSPAQATQASIERTALRRSIVAAAALGGLAMVWGVASELRILLLDGAYALIGIALTWFGLQAARAVEEGPTKRFPFGRDAFTPLAVLLQGVALAGTLLYALADAVVLLREGGDPVATRSLVLYGLISALGAAAVYVSLRRTGSDSDLVGAEIATWRASAVLSVGMVVGAVVAIVLDESTSLDVTAYVDPVLVILACVALAPTPVGLLRSGVRELLQGAPSAEVQESVRAVVDQVQNQFGLDEPIVRMRKVGRKLFLEVDFVVEPDGWQVSDEDDVRRAVLAGLEPLGFELWAYIELTTDRSLVE
ncbi:cation efflux family transporter [Mumia zhuanghuii]|uniref:Cation transporter n=2 Tax=Mumia TaxID=1546255 RepID=A0ABW1QKC2_9ACTN|nr:MULTISPECIES: cation transporter [Mumia]KAA1418231.1 cation efflux family transporter [Mumia zhuanghuii]